MIQVFHTLTPSPYPHAWQFALVVLSIQGIYFPDPWFWVGPCDLIVCVCSVTQLCLLLCDLMDCSPPGFSVRGISQQEHWSGLPFPLHGIFPTQGSNLCLLHLLPWQVDSLPLAPPRKSCDLMGPLQLQQLWCKWKFVKVTAISMPFLPLILPWEQV